MDSTPQQTLAPEEEQARLAALESLSILDSLPEQDYEDITELASFICGTPIALVSLVDADRQWFKSERGLGLRETSRSESFCAHTLPTSQTLVVPDAANDSRFRDNPLVVGGPRIRFYAGAPILERGGQVLGTVCVIDTQPRELSTRQIAALEALARQVMVLLEQRRILGTQARTAQHFQSSEERMRLAQKSARIASWDWELATGKFVWSGNPALIYGRPSRELGHIDLLMQCVHPDDRLLVEDALAPALEGTGELHAEFRLCWPDGSTHWVAYHGSPVRSSSGEVVRIVGVNINATERRLAEAALRQAEKLAAVGRLASTIAHEMNNPLESVTNLLYLARHSEGLPEVVEDYLDTAERELRRVSAIMSQTLRFHKQATNPRLMFASELFDSVLSLYQGRLVNAHVEVLRRERAKQSVLCFDGEIRQVLNNLVGNAIDAMHADGGRLVLRSREGTHWPSGRSGLVLTVGDTGTGMSNETRRRSFDAFFSTKGIGGTGLGLWVSREITARHNGTLLVRSSNVLPHRGTAFSLFLPFGAIDR